MYILCFLLNIYVYTYFFSKLESYSILLYYNLLFSFNKITFPKFLFKKVNILLLISERKGEIET